MNENLKTRVTKKGHSKRVSFEERGQDYENVEF
jgi:hypothetical protein